jgi:hypothetical protein
MIFAIEHFIGAIVLIAGGYWLHYKFGTKLAADVNQIKQLKL